MASHDRPAPIELQNRAAGHERKAFDKGQNASRGGSISMVLLVAAVLIGAAVGLIYVGHDYVEAYVLTLLAALGTVGVFSLFAIASGILRFAGRDQGNPLLKAVVDGAFDGIVVSDQAGRVIYANATYLDLIGAADLRDVRPIERVFIGDPDVSESIYRLLKAAREGRRLQEEVRITGTGSEGARWLRMRVRPLGEDRRDARLTVWSIADVTRERERQENVFQELQHAIDYLDHAPAGFFSVDPAGDIVYLNATLASWLDQTWRYRCRRRRSAADHDQRGAGRSKNRSFRSRPQDPRRQADTGAPFPQSCLWRGRLARRIAHIGAQPGKRRRQRPAACRRSALHALFPEYSHGDCHG